MAQSSRFSRTEALIGKQALKRLQNSTVAVFGIGGVGSFAAEALARSGVGRFVLIDNDLISESNINRQIHALYSTLGMPKAEVMKSRIIDINPNAVVKALPIFYLPGTDGIGWDFDYVIDAVDTVTAKLDIIMEAKKRNISIISAMGAGNKLDPTRFTTADIYETSVCPLAKVMRRELKKRGIKSLKVVYSKEPPQTDCVILPECGPSSEIDSVKGQVPASIAFVPSVMGLIIAGEVIKDIIEG